MAAQLDHQGKSQFSLPARWQRRRSRLLIFLLLIPSEGSAFSRLWRDSGMQPVRAAVVFAAGVMILLIMLSLVRLLLRRSPKREDDKSTLRL